MKIALIAKTEGNRYYIIYHEGERYFLLRAGELKPIICLIDKHDMKSFDRGTLPTLISGESIPNVNAFHNKTIFYHNKNLDHISFNTLTGTQRTLNVIEILFPE